MNIIKKNFKSNNVLKIWLVSFIIIPLFMFAMRFAWSDETDKFVFTWLFLILGSMAAQFFINVFRKVKSGKFQYLFILIVMNITMFLTFVLKNHTKMFDNFDTIWTEWFGKLLSSIVTSAILFIIKTLVWVGLMLKWKQVEQNKKKRIDLEDRNIELEKEHRDLKDKYELEMEAKAATEMQQEVTDEFSISKDKFVVPVEPVVIQEEDEPKEEKEITPSFIDEPIPFKVDEVEPVAEHETMHHKAGEFKHNNIEIVKPLNVDEPKPKKSEIDKPLDIDEHKKSKHEIFNPFNDTKEIFPPDEEKTILPHKEDKDHQ